MKNRLTIVGPEPSGPERHGRRKRLNVETVLLMAKYDGGFHRRLFADRETALAETGLNFSPAEKLMLLSISEDQLRQSIAEFRMPGIHRESLKSWARAAAVVLLLTTLSMADFACDSGPYIPAPTGSAPDDTTQTPIDGIMPDEGITPDDDIDNDVCRGSTPDTPDQDEDDDEDDEDDDGPMSFGIKPDR
ncbi:hypothetical protein ACFL6M_00575 [Candidatus Eisenbacteria bacterium]|uniref:Uncharacterized protein n=1 Tax=Eiseniibacteriota bacterium TaxID=2212470 RepID=A0ABV6YIX9_UNCEI